MLVRMSIRPFLRGTRGSNKYCLLTFLIIIDCQNDMEPNIHDIELVAGDAYDVDDDELEETWNGQMAGYMCNWSRDPGSNVNHAKLVLTFPANRSYR